MRMEERRARMWRQNAIKDGKLRRSRDPHAYERYLAAREDHRRATDALLGLLRASTPEEAEWHHAYYRLLGERRVYIYRRIADGLAGDEFDET